MADTKTQMTPEQYAAYITEFLESVKFKQLHIDDYDANPANAAKFAAFMQGKGWAWTEENLEKAFQLLKAAGEITAPTYTPKPLPPPPEVAPVEPPTFPWGPALTPQSLETMDAATMRNWLTSPKWGTEFKNQVREQQSKPYQSQFALSEKP